MNNAGAYRGSFWLCLCLASCQIFSPARKESPAEPDIPTTAPLQEVVRQMQNQVLSYEWLAAKAKVDIPTLDKHNAFSLHLRIRKDSIIWMSVTGTLGFEAARLLITPDSIKILDRLNNKAFIKPYHFFHSQIPLPFSFYDLQALLTGEAAALPKDLAFTTDTFALPDKKHLVLQGAAPQYTYHLWVDRQTYHIHKQSFQHVVANEQFTATYQGHEVVQNDSLAFPYYLTFYIQGRENHDMDLRYTRLKLNEPQSLPFNVPAKYDKVY